MLLLLTAQAPEPTLTSAELTTLTPDALATRLLGAAAALVAESRVDQTGPPSAPVVWRVEFASRPRSGEYAELCQADVITLDLQPATEGANSLWNRPLHVRALGKSKRFHVLEGPIPAKQTMNYWSSLQTRCAATKPVLLASRWPAGSYFASQSDGTSEHDANLIARIWRAQRLRPPSGAVVCERPRNDFARDIAGICKGHLAWLRAQSLNQAASADLRGCNDRLTLTCLEVVFFPNRPGLPWKIIVLTHTDVVTGTRPERAINITRSVIRFENGPPPT